MSMLNIYIAGAALNGIIFSIVFMFNSRHNTYKAILHMLVVVILLSWFLWFIPLVMPLFWKGFKYGKDKSGDD